MVDVDTEVFKFVVRAPYGFEYHACVVHVCVHSVLGP